MVRHSSLRFSGHEYFIDGKPLLKHLQKHEGVDEHRYMSAIVSQPDTLRRLIRQSDSDLFADMVAIYLCGMCGGYDGSPIGVRISIFEDYVEWSHMGYSSDAWEDDVFPFKKVSGFSFDKNEYMEFISKAQMYEVQ